MYDERLKLLIDLNKPKVAASILERLVILQGRIDHECSAALHHFNTWYAAHEWHMDRFMKLCDEKDKILEAI